MSIDTDTFFNTILEIKETVTRTEEQVKTNASDNAKQLLELSKINDRVTSLESSRNQVYGVMGTITLAWVVLIAWINGLGDWIHHFFSGTGGVEHNI